MCTVTFLSANNNYILTSNRDEIISRPASFQAAESVLNDLKIYFPRDTKAGGTWFAVSEKGVTAVLLNGAFQNHVKDPGYARSRGHILLDIISTPSPSSALTAISLNNIEPFTMVLFENNHLIEFRWDGTRKYELQLNIEKNYIWSSATLYSDKIIRYRQRLFHEFLKNTKHINEHVVMDFHSGNNNDFENGFVINRNDQLKTLSITQAVISSNRIDLNHFDLLNNQKQTILVPIKTELKSLS